MPYPYLAVSETDGQEKRKFLCLGPHPLISLEDILPLPTLGVRHGQQLLAVPIHADERVGVLLLVQITEGVVDAPVARLVGPNVQNQVLHRAVALGHVPIRHGNVRDLELGVGPPGEEPLVELVDAARIRVYGLLLEVPYETVANARADEVGEEHGVLMKSTASQSITYSSKWNSGSCAGAV